MELQTLDRVLPLGLNRAYYTREQNFSGKKEVDLFRCSHSLRSQVTVPLGFVLS
jgi:hypothetical protein